NVVPVIDIARRFQIGATDMVENSRVVIVENKDETVGFLAEGVSTVSRFESVAIQPPPPLTAGISSEFLEGVVRVQDRFLIFLDLERILSYEMTTLE
ncbi:chemotaxis protein CheW, partial [Myxococcota bacterium]|nr:chemotaxis protein CheW [Myxococcota bacterium]